MSEFARNPGRRGYSLVVLTLVISTLGACGHGPPEYLASIADYDTPSGGRVTIALRSWEVIRPARGISAYPDGGMAIVVDGGVEGTFASSKLEHSVRSLSCTSMSTQALRLR
jgi:hypothetical protein